MRASVSHKGQVTIPKPLRERLALRAGTVLEFEAQGGRLVAIKAETNQDPVLAVTGIIRCTGGTDAYLDDVRGPAR